MESRRGQTDVVIAAAGAEAPGPIPRILRAGHIVAHLPSPATPRINAYRGYALEEACLLLIDGIAGLGPRVHAVTPKPANPERSFGRSGRRGAS